MNQTYYGLSGYIDCVYDRQWTTANVQPQNHQVDNEHQSIMTVYIVYYFLLSLT